MFIPVKISFDDGMCTDSLITLSCTTVWKQYCTMDKLMLTQAFKIGLLSAKSDLSRTNLLQKVRLRTKVRENRTLWEHCMPLFTPIKCGNKTKIVIFINTPPVKLIFAQDIQEKDDAQLEFCVYRDYAVHTLSGG